MTSWLLVEKYSISGIWYLQNLWIKPNESCWFWCQICNILLQYVRNCRWIGKYVEIVKQSLSFYAWQKLMTPAHWFKCVAVHFFDKLLMGMKSAACTKIQSTNFISLFLHIYLSIYSFTLVEVWKQWRIQGGPITSNFMQLLAKICPNNRFLPQIQGLAPLSRKSWVHWNILYIWHWIQHKPFSLINRKHSSRMRTAHLSPY